MLFFNYSRILLASLLSAGVFAVYGCSSGSNNLPGQTIGDRESGLGVFSNDGLEAGGNPLEEYVDCKGRFPCVWTSIDTGVSITLESVVRDFGTNQLEIAYTVQTTRDTIINVLDTATAVDSTGGRYTGNDDTSGAVELLAGVRLTVTQSFREAATLSARSIARFAFEFIEGGMSSHVGFLDLPLNSATGDEVNCRSALPCTWSPDNAEYAVSVVLVEGVTSGRLTVHYEVEAFEDVLITVDSGSIAIGNEGTVFDPKIHTLGELTDYRSFEATILGGASVSGTQSYLRTANSVATKLKKLTLQLSQTGTPGGGVPVFINLPVY